VQALLQALFATAAQQPLEQHSSWIKSSCNLLLRALTRSPQFITDPVLPLLPGDALGLLSWLNATGMGTRAAAATAGHASAGTPGDVALSNGSMQQHGVSEPDADDAAHSSSPFATGEDQSLAQQQQQYGAGKLLLRDDKVYLLLTKLIITATGLSPEAAAAAAAAHDAADADVTDSTPASSSHGAAAAVANGSATSRTVAFTRPLAPTPASAAGAGNSSDSSSASISDPGLLIQLLEWSSTKVKLAMQLLLDAGGE
jgi:hypothetical protein